MNLKKEITFIYLDRADYQNYLPICEEAEKRGYKVKMTQNPFEKCEIGIYCQHNNFPENSKFSVIMLHDIIQGYGRWPDIWADEPWNKYDIGILPGQSWKTMWKESSKYYYTRPRSGVYEIGWPKADALNKIDRDKLKEKLTDQYHMDFSKLTVLYAPAWENDYKQDDFVKAMKDINVNILIKQAPMDPTVSPLYKKVYEDINLMYEMHKDLDNVTILDPKTNIMEAIAVADILVSEESSTMCEAVMLGIPAVSVSNWLIPDSNPKRYPETDYDFVVKTKKEELRSCVKHIIDNYATYKQEAEMYSSKNFKNIGKTSSIIMDIIDEYRKSGDCTREKIQPNEKKKLSLCEYLKIKDHDFRIRVVHNWAKQSALIKKLLKIYQGGKIR